ncbi:FAD-dependent oxidoreductase [Shimia sp. CNT1-13L.2]|uniref:NAD(P)/FAD-dependent oxidoreductase n=1 Tax=Shimia sp. CNT1-13L.2 TaxID=2959663 RepID=UPI0020CC4BEB|nr:FAD-dependent oxidoreductase [Shimia sp. CNT1-13L.2]MCP9483440.1 FAD-dependent oxidoreductase [Shimia sp. CNT1-13L.2]
MTTQVTVLGAGIVGICSALSLLERGHQVTLIDRDAPGQATSLGNAGVISPWSIIPQSMPGTWKKVPGWMLDPLGPVSVPVRYFPWIATWGLRFLANSREHRVREISAGMETLNRDCVTGFRNHLRGTGAEDLVEDSYYVHAYRDPNAASLDTLDNRIRLAAGAELDCVSGGELLEIEPDLSPDFKSAVIIKGQARARSPGRIGAVLAEKFQTMGGEIRREALHSIAPNGDQWIYRTDAGEFITPKLVLSMGAWSAKFLKPLGIRLPLEAERGYHVTFTKPGIKLNNSVLDADNKFVASSMEDGVRAAGTAEFAGLDAPINEKRITGLIELAKRISPKLKTEARTTWSGQRPSFPDSLPAIGEIPGFPNLITAFGHSHYGLMQAPKTGQLVAELVSGARPNIDMNIYSPTRF